MSATALKLTPSPLTLDWSGLLSLPTLHESSEITQDAQFQEAWSSLKRRFENEVGFFDSPTREDLSAAEASVSLAKKILSENRFSDCLFIGIGGSSLGPIASLSALEHLSSSSIQFHFLENPDPIHFRSTTQKLDPEKTLVVGVTKSGSTFETLSLWMATLTWLGTERWKKNCVVLTDPKKGEILEFAKREQIPTLPIASSIGGRFSVFTPVGLFPLALRNLDVANFLRGASEVRSFFEKTPLEKNPLFHISLRMIHAFPKINVHVCMPYSTPLRWFANWWVQLWGESLGKDQKGFTPLAALGANDQHSILQLLRDGPKDKLVWFLYVDDVTDPVAIPSHPSFRHGHTETMRLLEGHSLHELIRIEQRSIARVLTNQGRPHFGLGIDRLDERNLGALMFLSCTWTAVCGTLWKVNPFDQPGVEEGKEYIRDALSNPY